MVRSDNSVVEALFGIGFGGLFFFRGLRLWREMRYIQNTPRSKISSVAMGDAEICGEAKAQKVIQAPFSGRECVYCSFTVEEPYKNGWKKIDHGLKTSIFYVDDGTGQLLLNPEGATFYGPQTYQQVYGSEGMMVPGVASWVNERREKSLLGSLSVSGRHRYTEYVICPGQSVFVEGYVSKARHAVNGRTQEEDIIGARDSGHFILSVYSEEGLLSQFGWKVPLQVFGGMALLLACLWYVVQYFQLERFIR